MVSIHSLHSVHGSIDPAGVDPSGIDVIHGADPPPDDEFVEPNLPILPSTSPAGPPPPTPRRAHDSTYSRSAPSPVMALLIGEPPPPPPTPPPLNNRARMPSPRPGRHSSTTGKQGPTSPPGDASSTNGFSAFSSSFHRQRSGTRDPLERGATESSSTTNFVEQKRREALAIYQSPDLYMDDPAQSFESDINSDRAGLEVATVANTQLVKMESSSENSSKMILASPTSAATEPHSNKRTLALSRRASRAQSQEPLMSLATKVAPPTDVSSKIAKQCDPKNKQIKSRKGRGRSLERPKRSETPSKQREPSEKRGFFQKLFRGGGHKRRSSDFQAAAEQGINPHDDEDLQKTPPMDMTEILPPQEPAQKVTFHDGLPKVRNPRPTENVSEKYPSLEVNTDAKASHLHLPASPDAGDTKEVDLGFAGLDTVTSGLTNDVEPDRREVFFAHDEVSTLTAPSARSSGRRIDPVEQETVATDHSSEPTGRYWNVTSHGNMDSIPTQASPTIDPFVQPFFQEPDGESPVTSKKVANTNATTTASSSARTKTSLQVHVPDGRDPTGDTPSSGKRSTSHMNEPSPRGWQSPVTELKDPLGSTISESASKRRVPSFGRQSQANQTPKLPPTQKRGQTHEVRREPSAFRDGSPYALDPLPSHDEGDCDVKSLADIISRRPSAGANKGRNAVEPPDTANSSNRSRLQPPTPSDRLGRIDPTESEFKEKTLVEALIVPDRIPTVDARDGTKRANQKPSSIDQNAKDHPTLASMIASSQSTPKKKSLQCNASEGMDSATLLEYPKSSRLEDRVDRNTNHDNHASLEENSSDARKREDPCENGTERLGSPEMSAKVHTVEIHRTQRLSLSPRERNETTLDRGQRDHEGITAISACKSPRRYRGGINHGIQEEEKKEQDHKPLYQSDREPQSNTKLATGTAALSTAACMNAKTVAYLHTLNGEPSPRHAWGRPDLSDDDYSPIKSGLQRKAVTNIKSAMAKKRIASAHHTDEAAFDCFISSGPPKTPVANKHSVVIFRTEDEAAFDSFISSVSPKVPAIKKRNGLAHKSAVNAKPFHSSESSSRQSDHFSQTPAPSSPKTFSKNKTVGVSRPGTVSPRSRKLAQQSFRRPVDWFRFNRDVGISGSPVVYGLNLIREKRKKDILRGVVVTTYKKKQRTSRRPTKATFQPVDEEEIKDPIQRAGRRLLSKAAIPIQSAARRYLACGEAVRRMQATLVIQAYMRRWRCEAYLRAYKHAAVQIQAAYRSKLTRQEIAYMHYSALQIQRIVRGYIAAAFVYDVIYWVSRLQATMRGKLARTRFENLLRLREVNALRIQAWYRGCNSRQEAVARKMAILSIQAACRSFSARSSYQLRVKNIIITQCIARQFIARRVLQEKKSAVMHCAACKIQATWRGFQGYTDYIFALVDILVLQRSMRKWLAKNKAEKIRRERAAIKIQAQWRRQTALIGMLYELVHIIIAQSVARRFLARKMLPKKRLEYSRRMKHQQKLDKAATRIQTAWRGFWGYSHFIIMQYEIIRLQAIVRGRASRILFSLKLGCCIMIQSAARRFLASKKANNLKLKNAAMGAKVECRRTARACRQIQFWWRVVLECSREKNAALIIERFFLMVKAEVDKEIVRQQLIQANQNKGISKRSTTPRKTRKPDPARDADDEKLLERAWLNTVDEDIVEMFAGASPSNGTEIANSTEYMLNRNPSLISEPVEAGTPSRGIKHRPSSPTMNLVMRHEYNPSMRHESGHRDRKQESLKDWRPMKQSKPPSAVTLTKSDERTEVSAMTFPTLKGSEQSNNNIKKPSRPHLREFEDEMSLDDSLFGEDIVESKKQGMPFESKQQDHSGELKKVTPKARQTHSASSVATDSDISVPSQLYSKTATTVTRTTVNTSADTIASPRSEMNGEEAKKYGSHDKYATSAASKGIKLLESVRKGSGSSNTNREGGSRSGSKSRSGNTSRSRSGSTSRRRSASTSRSTTSRSGESRSDSRSASQSTSRSVSRSRHTRNRSVSSSSRSPRHGRIMVTNTYNDYPILSSDGDNVEVEYVGDQFGVI